MSFGGSGTGKGSISTDSDVALSNVANGDTLQYDSSVAKWENAAGGAATTASAISYDDSTTNFGVDDVQDAIVAATNLVEENESNIQGLQTFQQDTAIGASIWASSSGWPSTRPECVICMFIGPGVSKGAFQPSTAYSPWDIVTYDSNTYAWVGSGGASNPTAGTSGSSFTSSNWQQIPIQVSDLLLPEYS